MKFGESFEVIFFARGGEGGKTAAEILAQAAARDGKYVKAFPVFGPERSGAPTKVFLRVSEKPIRTQAPIVDPDVVVVMDETLLLSHAEEIARNLDRNESLIVNTTLTPDEVRRRIPEFSGKVHPIDASGIAQEETGRPIPNVVILGHLVKITEITDVRHVCDSFREIFEEKIGKEMTEKNIRAIERGYDEI